MPDREKVIEGLEFTLIESCWDADRAFDEQLMIEAVTDAIALLKEQEPRMMTLKEVRALQTDAVVWLEDNDKADVIPAIVNRVWNSLPKMVSFTTARMREVKADMLWYGVKWRCWTSRPTDEQREVAPWN